MIVPSLVFMAMAAGPAPSAAPEPGACTVVRRNSLDRVLEVDEFRIRYTLSGPDALVHREDTDGNGVPDMLDDLATQLVTARMLYGQVLGLRHPLDQPRYRRATRVEVLVRRLEGNGVAYDEVTRADARSPCGLSMAVSSALLPSRNLTAAHELFHLYQYGNALFKRAWYLEGMARWMESAFVAPGRRGAPDDPPPSCRAVADRSYDAAGYWRAAAAGGATLRYPAALRDRRYVDGSPVIAVAEFPGGGAVAPIFAALESASIDAARREGLPPYAVPEAVQRSARFDSAICAAVDRALRR